MRAWNAVSAFTNCGRAVAHVRGSYVPTPDSCTAANEISLFGHTLKRDHQYKLSPIDIPAMADGSPQLF